MAQEFQDAQDSLQQEKSELERKLRSSSERITSLLEELDEAEGELSSTKRQLQHRLSELQAQYDTLRRNNEEIHLERDARMADLQVAQQKLVDRDAEIERIGGELVQVKAHAGDADTLTVVKRELSEQVAHIKKLESTNSAQFIELKQFRKQQKAIEVVEEEKRTLEARVRIMHDLRKELSEAQLQRQILEDERKSWSAYLENMGSQEEDTRFDTPEDLAKAFLEERLRRLNLVDELGKFKPELTEREKTINELEEKVTTLKAELEKARSVASAPDPKLRTRLERQRTLAVKEVEYLRAQLKAFDTETNEFQPESYDAQKAQQLKDLEDLVDQYRKELQTVNTDLAKKEDLNTKDPNAGNLSTAGTKRPHTEDDDERLGALSRKNNTLQNTLSDLNTAHTLLERELEAHKSQLTALKSSSRTRVLELRNNPTANEEAVKLSTLKTLRTENEALVASLEAAQKHQKLEEVSAVKLVPYAHLERLRADLAAKDVELASAAKHTLRLKQIFGAKSAEFREAVASILGWRFDFMPNGRVRVTSMFHPGDPESEEGENSIVFDSDQGTMKVSGGPKSAFANEIRGLIEFWVDGKKEIPCFLAACTLEFWEKALTV